MPDTKAISPSTLLVFSDDWGRHPSSCQHLMARLLPRFRVVWANTIATRRPKFDWMTLRRGAEKLTHWFGSAPRTTSLPENLTVLNPVMWPWMTNIRDRAVNRRLLAAQLTKHLHSNSGDVVAISTLPIIADLVDQLAVSRWVYYCVDDLSQWPGLDRPVLESMEQSLVQRADVLIAASEQLREKLASQGRQAALLTHGVDLAHWQTNGHSPMPVPVDGLERPFVVFWGLIDRRMDLRFLSRLSNDLERGTILLVGPQSNADPELFRLKRVRWVPPLTYDRLPVLAHEASLLIMPYEDAPVTRAMQPLKLLEYLATEKPVVVRDLPAARDWSDCLDIIRTPEEFSEIVRTRLHSGLCAGQRAARQRLHRESWSAKATEFERLILAPVTPLD